MYVYAKLLADHTNPTCQSYQAMIQSVYQAKHPHESAAVVQVALVLERF